MNIKRIFIYNEIRKRIKSGVDQFRFWQIHSLIVE